MGNFVGRTTQKNNPTKSHTCYTSVNIGLQKQFNQASMLKSPSHEIAMVMVVVVNFISNRVQHLHGNENRHHQNTREIML